MGDFDQLAGYEYERLYHRFLKRSPDEILLANGPLKGKRVLDLCAGGLRASLRARDLGASYVLAVDKSESMMHGMGPPPWAEDPIIETCALDISGGFSSSPVNNLLYNPEPFDLVICQQAVNYWWNHKTVADIAKCLKLNGCFVFNTFWGKPKKEPKFRMGKVQTPDGGRESGHGQWIAEVSWRDGEMVHHVQMREGMEPHFTSFRWISMEEFEEDLMCAFNSVSWERKGGALIMVARNPASR